jgi:hypothetical protein
VESSEDRLKSVNLVHAAPGWSVAVEDKADAAYPLPVEQIGKHREATS